MVASSTGPPVSLTSSGRVYLCFFAGTAFFTGTDFFAGSGFLCSLTGALAAVFFP
jgi:hypothetical protein